MTISIKTKEGEKLLTLLKEGLDDSIISQYILVDNRDNIDKPYLRLTLGDDCRFVIGDKRDIDEDDDDLCNKLDSLALAVIEANQQGIDINDAELDTFSATERPYNPEQIRVEELRFSLRQIFDMIKDGDLDISPDFQRNEVWDEFRQARLIESILLRIPLPVFYFSQEEDGKLHVVDGLQRLSSIYRFMSSKLILRDLEYLTNCNGKVFAGKNGIEEKYFRRIKMTQISANVIDPQSPTKVKFDIFRRINTGGLPLNAQELRNCLSSKELRSALKIMVGSPFKKATSGSISDKRMAAQEMALRFIYFRYLLINSSISLYSGKMDDELDKMVDTISHDATFSLNEYVSAFENAMKNAVYLFGRHAFRKVCSTTKESDNRSVINKALFISWSVTLSNYTYEQITTKYKKGEMIKILGELIDNNMYYRHAITYGTNGKSNIITAFAAVAKILSE